MDQNQIRREVVAWIRKFPCDRWWREKHNIPFMSQAHKEISFLDQLKEYIEDELYEEMRERRSDEYTPNSGDFLKPDGKKSEIDRAREEFERQFLNDG